MTNLTFSPQNRKIFIVIGVIILLLIIILSVKICLDKQKRNKRNNLHGNLENTVETFNSRSFRTKVLHKEPDVTLIKGFLTPEECDYIIKLGDPDIKKSEVCGKNGSRPDKSRTSMTAHIGKKYLRNDNPDPVLTRILEKSEGYCGLPSKNIEPIQLVRYEPGQYFKPHYDYLDTKIDMYRANVKKNGQRKYTFFVYLTDVPKNVGGTTYFPKLKKHFKGKKGDAIFWDNIREDGKEDDRMLHSGTELKSGKKYGLNIWVRNKEYLG